MSPSKKVVLHNCNVIEYLSSSNARYLLLGTLCTSLYDVKYHYEQICSINIVRSKDELMIRTIEDLASESEPIHLPYP